MVKLITKETIALDRFNAGFASPVHIFKGDRFANKAASTPQTFSRHNVQGRQEEPFEIVKMGSAHWKDSEGYHKLWQEIGQLQYKIKEAQNAAQVPSAAALEALLGKIFIDMTRRAQEAGDLTSIICTEITDLGFAETINMRDIEDYIGEFADIQGTNDSVPLVEQNLGNTDTATMIIRALGWKDSLANMLYNRLHSMQKVNKAVDDANTDKRNQRTVGAIVGATFDASQKQAADATSSATDDVKMYYTIRDAIAKLRTLKDNKTDRKIAVPSISLLCNSTNTWSITRVINGQLTNGGAKGTINTSNMQALPISQIIEYDQGITHGRTWGKKTLSFPGVTAGKCYIFIPRLYSFVMNKRPLTMETGTGSVLQLSTEERAWYRVQIEYLKDFLGSSFSGASTSGYGAIIEVTLP
jgi:hypothetical protein